MLKFLGGMAPRQWRNKGGGQGRTSAPGRSTLGAPNWGRNITY